MFVPRNRSYFFVSTLFLFLCSTVLLTIGCRAAPPLPNQPATPSAQSARTTTLTLWHSLTDERRATLDAMAHDFHETYPNLTINTVYVGNRDDLTKQMTAAIALGTTPDLVLADRRQIAEFARQGGLQPLEPFIGDAQLGLSNDDKSDFLRGMLTIGQFPTLGKHIYGFPFNQEAFVLFYNDDLLKSVNVNRAPSTWEQFIEFASAATKDETYGWAMRANADTFEAMLASRGSALLTDAETRALFNERAGLASLKLIADLNEGGIAELAPSDDQARREFAAGKAAFYMGWMSELDTLQALQKETKTNFEIGVAPLPQLDPQDAWLLVRGELFGIAQNSGSHIEPDRARNAWFFVRWMTAPTQSARWVRAADAIPLRSSALTFIAPDLPSNARFRQIAMAFNGVLPSLAPQPAHLYIATVEDAIADLWLQGTQPKADLRAILDNMALRVNQILTVRP